MPKIWDKVLLTVSLGIPCLFAISLPPIVSRLGPVRTGTFAVPGLNRQHQYSLLYSVAPLMAFSSGARVTVEIVVGKSIVLRKTLHAGDPDLYTQFRVSHPGSATVRVTNSGVTGTFTLEVNRWPLSRIVRSGPGHRWQDAQEIDLGNTIFASGDDSPYIPLPGTSRLATEEDPNRTDWYWFKFSGPTPRLVFFQIDLTDWDQIPANVIVYRYDHGKLREYYDGEDPVTLPHEVQALPGNKFTPRILKTPGTYYIAVRSSHPEYRLRTRVYDPPPYSDPHAAVRTGVDYILAAGDSWHANTPRRGGILDRISSVHQETSLCVACHTTHFPLRAQLYATRNGYPVIERQQLQFLTERFYNNPRPFYGFEKEGALWARMISAPANVLGRM